MSRIVHRKVGNIEAIGNELELDKVRPLLPSAEKVSQNLQRFVNLLNGAREICCYCDKDIHDNEDETCPYCGADKGANEFVVSENYPKEPKNEIIREGVDWADMTVAVAIALGILVGTLIFFFVA